MYIYWFVYFDGVHAIFSISAVDLISTLFLQFHDCQTKLDKWLLL